ncbi:MAG: hypothetical protein KDA54_17595 [Phycisphaerales bacterium]|nr:hypothetical protein [Phycisphaerales bacterium]
MANDEHAKIVKRPSRRWYAVLIVAVSGLAGFLLGLGIPPMPAEWSRIKPGMDREAVLAAIVLGNLTDMRDVKGFDVVTWQPNERCYWQLKLNYASDDDETVTEVWVRYTDRRIGIFNLNEQMPNEHFIKKHTGDKKPRAIGFALIAMSFTSLVSWLRLRGQT